LSKRQRYILNEFTLIHVCFYDQPLNQIKFSLYISWWELSNFAWQQTASKTNRGP